MDDEEETLASRSALSRRTLLKAGGATGLATVSLFKSQVADAQSPLGSAITNSTSPSTGRPNVLLILVDDVGFADFGCYGGEIATPAIDRLAADGLRFTGFRTAAVCAATRAAMMTGINNHAVGIGRITDEDRHLPGYRGDLSLQAATLAEALKAGGYQTFHVGKWHLNFAASSSVAGPRYNWPLQRGFDRAYWFQGHSSDYFDPSELYSGNDPVERGSGDEYYITDDFGDKAIEYIDQAYSLAPEQPWFMYLAFNAAHAPLQVRKEDREAYRGRYDMGWDAVRASRLARQKELGITPPQVELPPRNPGVDAWSSLSAQDQRNYARYMEVYAGIIQRLDFNVGRILQHLETLGLTENTLVILASDNGGSAEGGKTGTANQLAFGPMRATPEEVERLHDQMGERGTFPHYPTGWAMVSNTPFKLYKQFTQLGGVSDPLIIRWPRRITQRGQIRREFVHAIDLHPTVLDIAGVPPLARRDGYAMKPVQGRSFAAAFDSLAPVPVRREQYFEMNGNRAFYRDGWYAVATHSPGGPFDVDRWELYDLRSDFNAAHEISAGHSDMLETLKGGWLKAARRNDVLPLDGRGMIERTRNAPWVRSGRRQWRLVPGVGRIGPDVAPATPGRNHKVDVVIGGRMQGQPGMLVAYGSMYFGWCLYIDPDDRLVYETANLPHRSQLVGTVRVPPGRCVVTVQQAMVQRPYAGTVQLLIDGQPVANRSQDRVLFGVAYQGLEIGCNGACPVGAGYTAPFPFAGTIERVDITLDTTPFDADELRQMARDVGLAM